MYLLPLASSPPGGLEWNACGSRQLFELQQNNLPNPDWFLDYESETHLNNGLQERFSSMEIVPGN